MYFIRKSFEDEQSQVADYKSLSAAKKRLEKLDGEYKIFDEDGNEYPISVESEAIVSDIDITPEAIENIDEPVTTTNVESDNVLEVEYKDTNTEIDTSGYVEVVEKSIDNDAIVAEFMRRKSSLY